MDDATAPQGQAFVALLPGELGSGQAPAKAVIEYKNDILREKLDRLVDQNAELREAVQRFAKLRENYESEK